MSTAWAIDLFHKFMIVLAVLIVIAIAYNLLFNDKHQKGKIKWHVLSIITKNGERLIVSMYEEGKTVATFTTRRQAESAMKRISKNKGIAILADRDRMY